MYQSQEALVWAKSRTPGQFGGDLTQRSQVSKFQGCKVSKFQGCKVSKFQGCNDAGKNSAIRT
jgi:hypothetical protein